MARVSRILLTENNNNNNSSSASSKSAAVAAAAPPPEAVALESDFVVILAVLLCALISAVGLIAAARCALRRRHEFNRRAGTNRYLSPPNKGLKKKVLQSLPIFTYTSTAQELVNKSGGNNSVKLAPLSSDCAICLGEFVVGDELRVLPQCGHGFHVACIDKWLGSHSSCPSCRQILAVERCHKCCQFPAVPSPSAGGGNNETELNSCENRSCTATNGASFLP